MERVTRGDSLIREVVLQSIRNLCGGLLTDPPRL